MSADQIVSTVIHWLRRVILVVLLAMIAVTLVNALDVVKLAFIKPFGAETLAYLAGAYFLTK